MSDRTQLMNQAAIRRALRRLATQIAQRNQDNAAVVLAGIQRGGVHLAGRISQLLGQQWQRTVPVGNVDVSMHRDDLDRRWPPHVHPTEIPFDLNGKTVVLVDDVLFHGRTVRAAIDALNDFGRPQSVQLAVLVDRGHRELPISADFVGKAIATAPQDRVDVLLEEDGEPDSVILEKNGLASETPAGH
jgi:pyrimidine operon attenuation protein/uracil phosphoribosyltransferase